ncbi:MAG: sterol desaturase family protein [Betaproteobacteria bacterium]
MADWLVAHQATVQSTLLVGSFALVAIWETFLPRREFATPLGSRWFSQIALAALGSLVTRLCLPVAAFSMALLAEQHGWGLFNQLTMPSWAACALGVLAIDLGSYAQHRAYHAVPLLWRFHRIHHSDLDVDCGTAIRHHPLETLAAGAFDVALVAAIGAPPLAVILAASLAIVASVFNHGNVRLPQAVDRLMRWIIVTPDMHRIHHSLVVGESNRNFSNGLPWWDHLFGSYQREPVHGHEKMELGIAEARNPADVALWRLLRMPLRQASAPTLSIATLGRPKLSPQSRAGM